MHLLKSSALIHSESLISDNESLLHALAESALVLNHSGHYPYFTAQYQAPSLFYEIIHLETQEARHYFITVTEHTYDHCTEQYLLNVLNSLIESDLGSTTTEDLIKQFPALLDEMDECTQLTQARTFLPKMLAALLQYAQLIGQTYQQIAPPQMSTTLNNFIVRLGFISHLTIDFTELIHYFIDFSAYCFDIDSETLLILTLHHLVQSHMSDMDTTLTHPLKSS